MSDTVTVDVSGAISRSIALRQLSANIQDKVASRSVVALKRRLGPEVNRQFSEVLNLSKAEVSKRVTVTSGDGFVDLTVSGKRVPLGKFGAQYGGHKTPGATAQVFKGQQSKVYTSAFMLSRKGAVLARKRVGDKRVGRFPVHTLFGPDLGSVLISPDHGMVTNLTDFAFELLSEETARLINVELGNI
jgi:hypothetical protein